jgi:two-component system sensor histidine kinase PilS (NtrC family)
VSVPGAWPAVVGGAGERRATAPAAESDATHPEGAAGSRRRRHIEALRTVKYLMVFRVALATLLLCTVVVAALGNGSVETLSGPFARFGFGLLFVTYLASLAYGIAYKRVRDPIRFAYLQITADLMLASLLVHATGGGQSAFFFLYFLDVVAVALLAQRRGAAIVASASAVLMVAISVAGYLHALPLVPGQSWLPWDIARDDLALRLALNVLALGAVGALATNLARQTRQAGERLTRHERYAGDLATLHENTIRSLTSGLVTLDLEGRVTSINEAACEILGMSRGHLLSNVLGSHLPQLAALLSEAGPRATLRRAEITAQRPDGAVRNLGISAAPLADHAGRVIGRVIHFQDLTELRRMQLEVERAERLASIGRLAAGIAHEIRNPLASISGSIEMLKTTPGADSESRLLMDIAVREVDRLNRLITDLLDYARPHGEERRRFDLGEQVSEIVHAFEQERREKIVVVTSEVEPGVIIEAAAGQLRQVLWNLIRNAAEAMPGGGAIQIRLASEGELATLTIRDQGPGIPDDCAERIFEPFYSTKAGGTGLGLATVARIVTDHRGTINLDRAAARSEPAGATFTVRLPLATPSAITPPIGATTTPITTSITTVDSVPLSGSLRALSRD